MVRQKLSDEEIWKVLNGIPDPEIPVITIVDLGVVRDVQTTDETITVTITPTYSGCPAMNMIEKDILTNLATVDERPIRVKTVFSPAWTTDWISDDARERLRAYGIAPPVGSADKNSLLGNDRSVKCPRCGSANTKMISQFGSTACKALYQCNECLEPFDYFKCI
jgi:ring-1,2-phenylacetyl-CoA epoxidase subunit PaaD